MLIVIILQGGWKPALNISTLLTMIQLLMAEPNPDDPLMVDIVSFQVSQNSQCFSFTIYILVKTHANKLK